MTSIVVHYQEIALKGKNRPWFLGKLVSNLRRALKGLDIVDTRNVLDRRGAAAAGLRVVGVGR